MKKLFPIDIKGVSLVLIKYSLDIVFNIVHYERVFNFQSRNHNLYVTYIIGKLRYIVLIDVMASMCKSNFFHSLCDDIICYDLCNVLN